MTDQEVHRLWGLLQPLGGGLAHGKCVLGGRTCSHTSDQEEVWNDVVVGGLLWKHKGTERQMAGPRVQVLPMSCWDSDAVTRMM